MARKTRDPLGPIEFVVSLTVGFFAITLAIVTLLSVFQVDGWHFRQAEQVCVRVTTGALYGTAQPLSVMRPLPAGTVVEAPVTAACTEHPTHAQRAWSEVGAFAHPGFAAGTFLLLWWVIRRARRAGIFSIRSATALTWLGWYVVAGSVLAELVGYAVDRHLLRQLVPDAGDPGNDFPVAWSSLVVGLGLVSLGRVMRHAASLQDEVDATV